MCFMVLILKKSGLMLQIVSTGVNSVEQWLLLQRKSGAPVAILPDMISMAMVESVVIPENAAIGIWARIISYFSSRYSRPVADIRSSTLPLEYIQSVINNSMMPSPLLTVIFFCACE